MKLVLLSLLVALTTSFTFQSIISSRSIASTSTTTTLYEYIPSGISKEQWKKMKEAEKTKKSGKVRSEATSGGARSARRHYSSLRSSLSSFAPPSPSNQNPQNLGKVGITSFQSRTFADWQKAGGKNLFPVDPKKVKSVNELPYMQRPGGRPDNSDLKKGKAAAKPAFSFGAKKAPVKAVPAKRPAGSFGRKKAEPVIEEPKKKGFFGMF